ncbi:MAG: hypothetical protein LBV04_03755 [Deferribacteraceae bacterium]|jgi:dihydroxyacetone kinase phosphotransfer subunit|nr:hypothetical protein [Deferribacteraceae bacterium]
MVALVLVSHSYALANAVMGLAKEVNPGIDVPIACAGGVGKDHEFLGTDATEIMEAIKSVYSPDGVVVLMDLGSAVISTQLAIDMLGDNFPLVRICPAPLVEGAVSAAVQSITGSPIDEVYDEAIQAIRAKQGLFSAYNS